MDKPVVPVTNASMGGLTPPATPNAKAAKDPSDNLSVAERSELIVDSVLVVLQHTGLAQLVQDVPGLAFSTGKPGEYASGAKALSGDSIKQVRIDTGDGRVRYFKQVASADYPNEKFVPKKGESELEAAERRGRNAGFRATAWQETDKNGNVLKNPDGTCDIRFCFPGFTVDDTAALTPVLIKGEPNPQLHAVPAFVNETLDKVYGKKRENIGKAHVVGNSLGAANGLVAQRCLLIGDVPCDAMTSLEPFGVSLAHDYVAEQLQWSGSLLSQNISRFPTGSLMSTGAETIGNPNMSLVYDRSYRAVTFTEDGKVKSVSRTASLAPGGSKDNNKMIGQETLIDMKGYRNITPGLPGILDPLHSNGNIAAQLIAQNKAAIAAQKDKEAKGKER